MTNEIFSMYTEGWPKEMRRTSTGLRKVILTSIDPATNKKELRVGVMTIDF